MRARYLALCLLICSGIALFLLLPAKKQKAGPVPESTKQADVVVPDTNPPAPLEKQPQPQLAKMDVNHDPLASAYEMATFIGQVCDSVPPKRATTRLQMKGLQVVFFLNDYVMAAKTNNSLALSQSAIIGAFTNVSQDTAMISDRLVTYADFPGTLSDHYRSISQIPTEKENIKTIEAALTENGVAIDTESDLLMDCIRYAYYHNHIYEFYGPASETSYPPELNALVSASDTVFRHRFETRFGLNSNTVTNLMNRLMKVQIRDISDAGFQVPAHIH